ncbi:hypothetical protein [Halodesulfurarchaeum sp.]|nr:hypothetical protein [Halodesulfurarchaeum sp.]
MTESGHRPVTDQLEEALEEIHHPEAQYHLRQCLQLLEDERALDEQKG